MMLFHDIILDEKAFHTAASDLSDLVTRTETLRDELKTLYTELKGALDTPAGRQVEFTATNVLIKPIDDLLLVVKHTSDLGNGMSATRPRPSRSRTLARIWIGKTVRFTTNGKSLTTMPCTILRKTGQSALRWKRAGITWALCSATLPETPTTFRKRPISTSASSGFGSSWEDPLLWAESLLCWRSGQNRSAQSRRSDLRIRVRMIAEFRKEHPKATA